MLQRFDRRAERVAAPACVLDPATAASVAPGHVAVIPDGNRRWARAQGLPVAAGHRQGFLVTAPAILDRLFERGCQCVSLWLFSTDNWRRSPEEVADLMAIYRAFMGVLQPLCERRNLRVLHWGRRDRVPADLMGALDDLCDRTQDHGAGQLVLALDYGGADMLLTTVRALAAEGRLPEDDAALLRRLTGLPASIPPMDLVLRTSGEQRLSGFAPLSAATAELCFVDTCFPGLTAAQIDAFVDDFARRERRGGV
ncbi:polyprenyl diphosphate synthase [Caulobacter segnis]|nr:polyprenyl diphosphate synthase [Caulobacter segnis]